MILHAVHALPYLIFTEILRRMYYYDTYFTAVEKLSI